MQTELHRYAQRMHDLYGGRVVAKDNIHLTLAFLGSLSLERTDELRAIGSSLRTGRFDLDLTRAGCWKRSQIGWIAPEQVPATLDLLVLRLHDLVSRSGIPVDDKPFRPHVSLLRKAKCSAKAASPGIRLAWSVDSFALIGSRTLHTGPVYSTIEEWQLV